MYISPAISPKPSCLARALDICNCSSVLFSPSAACCALVKPISLFVLYIPNAMSAGINAASPKASKNTSPVDILSPSSNVANWAKYSAPAGSPVCNGVCAAKFIACLVDGLSVCPSAREGFIYFITPRLVRVITAGAIILVAIPPVTPSIPPIIIPLVAAYFRASWTISSLSINSTIDSGLEISMPFVFKYSTKEWLYSISPDTPPVPKNCAPNWATAPKPLVNDAIPKLVPNIAVVAAAERPNTSRIT